MRKNCPCRAGPLGLALFLGFLGVAGDQRLASGGPRDPTLTVSDQRGLVEVFRKRQPRAEIPLLRGVHVVEVGPDGMVLEIQAEIEGFLLEMAGRTGIGRLWSQRLLPTADGRGWSLRGVVIEGRPGGRLTIAEAAWVAAGRLVATGPYTWERGQRNRAGSHGCFLVELRDGLRVRDLTGAGGRVLDCAPTRLPPMGGDGPEALVSGFPLEPMLPFLALLPSVPPRGPRAARLTEWLLPSLVPGLPRSATGRVREGLDP